MNAVGYMTMPAEFAYRDVFLLGKPEHDRYDLFSAKHPKMDVGHRAKIFAPFDALKGFSEAVASKDVLYVDHVELQDEDRAELNRRLEILHNLTFNGRMARQNRVHVSVTYYEPCMDVNSEVYGLKGQYKTISGICWKVDSEIEQTIRVDRKEIPFEDILKIESINDVFSRAWDTYFAD